MDKQYLRINREQGYRRKIGHRIVRRLLLQSGSAPEGGSAPHEQGVAIGRRSGRKLTANHAACAGAVVDDDWLTEHLRQSAAHKARHEIARAPGRERHDPAGGPVWVILC